jgi:hypothetical protein
MKVQDLGTSSARPKGKKREGPVSEAGDVKKESRWKPTLGERVPSGKLDSGSQQEHQRGNRKQSKGARSDRG